MRSRDKRTRVVSSSILGIALVFQLCAAANAQVQYNGIDLVPTQVVDDIPTYDITQTEGSNGYLAIDCQEAIVNFDADLWDGVIDVGFSACKGTDCPGPTLNFGLNAAAGVIYVGPCSQVELRGGSVKHSVSVYPGADVAIYGDSFNVFDPVWHLYDPGTVLHGTGDGTVLVFAYSGSTTLFSGPIYIADGASVLLGTPAGPEPEDPDIGEVTIEVKPGSDPSIINMRSNGLVPVAVLSDPGNAFDATQVLPGTVEFAGASVALNGSGKYMAHAEDVDGDGIADMLFHFRTNDLQLEDGVAEAVVELTGRVGSLVAVQSAGLVDDFTPISGTDNVYILRPKKK